MRKQVSTITPGVIISLCLAICSTAGADIIKSNPNWDTNMAMHTAMSADTTPQVRELLGRVASTGSGQMVDSLKAISSSSQPDPVQERILFDFVNGLRDFPAASVAPEILDYLYNYQPKTLIAHHDHLEVAVPLFNISAATKGVENEWEKREATATAANLVANNPQALPALYAGSNSNQQRGYLNALKVADQESLTSILSISRQAMDQNKDLAALAGTTALHLGEATAFYQILHSASGPTTNQLLRRGASLLSIQQSINLINTAIRDNNTQLAALSIAQFGERLVNDSNGSSLLFDLLASPELGSTAALALSKNTSSDIQDRLSTLSETDNRLAAARAKMALEAQETTKGLR